MSFAGRNWAKIGKKLLQGESDERADQQRDAPGEPAGGPTDSVIGLYSNQGGSACAGLPASRVWAQPERPVESRGFASATPG